MRKFYRFLIIMLLVVTFGISSSVYSASPESEIVVSAAASLKDAFSEIGTLYQKSTGTKVVFNFGASGVLQKQIEGGAHVDVFASAAKKQMDELEAKGFISPETRKDFAGNILTLVVPKGSEINIDSFEDLENPELRRIAIGNPKTVPAGQYTEQLLVNMKLRDKVQSKLILGENVRQVLDYVAREEVEAGIVYSSDVAIAAGKVKAVVAASESLHDPILYVIAVLKESKHDEAGKEFIDWVLSPEGQFILKNYGFLNLK